MAKVTTSTGRTMKAKKKGKITDRDKKNKVKKYKGQG